MSAFVGKCFAGCLEHFNISLLFVSPRKLNVTLFYITANRHRDGSIQQMEESYLHQQVVETKNTAKRERTSQTKRLLKLLRASSHSYFTK